MSKIENGFVPLSKVEREQPVENIQFFLNLPEYVDQDRIGVNLGRILRIGTLSGLSSVKVIGKIEEVDAEEVPQIVGINPDGSAIASKTSTKTTEPTYDFDTNDVLPEGMKHKPRICERQRDVTIKVNLEKIATEAASSSEGIRSARSWTIGLDDQIRCSLKEAGVKNLTSDPNKSDKGLLGDYAWILGMSIAFTPNFVIQTHNAAGAIIPISLGLGGVVVGKYIENKKGNERPYYRPSILPSAQYDRALLLKILASRPIIKDLGKPKAK